LQAGYDLLLEKPLAISEEEMQVLVDAARRYGRRVMICHVLRYAPFYAEIRKRVALGAVGRLISIQTTEHVSFHHAVVGYVRGKYRSKKLCGTSMLLSKCCHDLDLIAWMKSGTAPVSVFSYGNRMQFRPEMAPEAAGSRCLVDCPKEVEERCLYSARKHYLDHPDRWTPYVWSALDHIENPTIEQKRASLMEETNPYGRCVYTHDNDVVDHQAVVVEFEDGCIATHNMVAGSAEGSRSIHIIGTEGEISGKLEESRFTVRLLDPGPARNFREEVVEVDVKGDMHGAFGGHGGGDLRLVRDFVRVLQGGPVSISSTTLDDSIYGHLLCYRADESMEQRRPRELPSAERLKEAAAGVAVAPLSSSV
jgi:predicted dehydrogenase